MRLGQSGGVAVLVTRRETVGAARKQAVLDSRIAFARLFAKLAAVADKKTGVAGTITYSLSLPA